MSVLPNPPMIRMSSQSKSRHFFNGEIDKLILNCTWTGTGSRRAKAILKRTTNLEDLYYVISSCTLNLQRSRLWFWQESRYTDQWSRTKTPETDPHTISWLIFFFFQKKCSINSVGEKKGLLFVCFFLWFWNKWIYMWGGKKDFELYVTPYTITARPQT